MTNVVQVENDGGVFWVTLTAPQVGNVLNAVLIDRLRQAVAQANADPTCRVIVLRAQGADFCKGLDLAWTVAHHGPPDGAFLQDVVDGLTAITTADKPVIACVEGAVSGGGVGLVAACDLVLAGTQATFMLPEVIIGMIPALITPFLLRRMPLAHVRYLTLSSRSLDASEAKAFGLVDEVADANEGALAHLLERQLQRLFRSSPAALAESKRYFQELEQGQLAQQTQLARRHLDTWLAQPAVATGLQSFVEGFSPEWWAKYRLKNF